VRQAINDYVEKLQRKNRLMSYAGILDETEAMLNSIFDTIRQSQQKFGKLMYEKG
jgi:hypothetical protein